MTNQTTWTAFPSLLTTLESDEGRVALEEAACAHYCGRYEDAAAIFDSTLPASSALPILTLQRADMLTMQGKEHERIKLLNEALHSAEARSDVTNSSRLLMRFMLADALFWAFGIMRNAVDLLPQIRRHLQERRMECLSDIDVHTSSGL